MEQSSGLTKIELDYIEAIKEAEKLGAQVVAHGHTSSRENSLSYTELQNARLWFEKGQAEKQYREEQKAAHEN